MKFTYTIEVDNGRESAEGGPYVASTDGNAIRGIGDTPILALAALARALARWPIDGAERYFAEGGRILS